MPITIEMSEFPLVRIVYDGPVDDAGFREHLAEYQELLQQNRQYAIVFDARRADRPPASQRQMQSEFISEHRVVLRRLCVGGSFVIQSPLIRGALTAILWISPLPFPHEVFGDIEAASQWARSQLDHAGVRAA